MIIEMGTVENKMFLLLYLSSDTNFDIDIGRLSCVIVIAKEKVGKINMYKLIPSIPTTRVIMTLIKRPNNLVIKPPIIKIIVDMINFSFIIQVYVRERKKEDFLFFLNNIFIQRIILQSMILSLLIEIISMLFLSPFYSYFPPHYNYNKKYKKSKLK